MTYVADRPRHRPTHPAPKGDAPAHAPDGPERYRLLVDSIVDYAIFMLDAQGRIASWNRGAERLKGYTADEIIGQHFSRFYTEEDRAAGLPAEVLRLAAETGQAEREGWRVRKNGTRFWAHVVIDPVRDAAGNLVGFAKITRDLTERREAEIALRTAQEALFQSQKMEAVGQLTGGVAHDFNNLLTVILGGLDTIRRSDLADPARVTRAAEMAYHAAQRAAGLTARLLAFSRKQPLAPVPTDLNRLLRDMTELLHRTLGETTELEVVTSPGLWPVELDPNQLESALVNLAVNARDAMPGGGKLTIETGNAHLDQRYVAGDAEVVPGQYAMLSVTDTGSGIAPALIKRVFDPFFTTKPAGQGTGLGLSMVYGFVKQSRGHVTIYSEEGEGTTVKLYFPRHGRGVAQDLAAETAVGPAGGDGEVVLVVEDSEDVRRYSTATLRELGYRVAAVDNADAALAVLAGDERVDLLFTDVVLPGRSGRALADEAVKLRPGLKVLFTTGYSRDAIVHHGRLDAGVQLLPKPFTPDQLAAGVRDILDRP